MTLRATDAQRRRVLFPLFFHPPCPNSFSLAISPLVKSPTAISTSSSWGFLNSTAFCCRNPATAISWRLILLPSVSGIWDGGGNSARDAVLAIRRGMLLFRKGDVHGSLARFDKAIELDPRQKAYEEGVEQFRIDVGQNPNDTEESIWCFLGEAQLYGVDEARRRFLDVMNYDWLIVNPGRQGSTTCDGEAYKLFKDGGDPEKLVTRFLEGRENEYFYAYLYAGLCYESENKPDEAKRCIVSACRSPYGERSDDYMVSLAKVHCLCRVWISG